MARKMGLRSLPWYTESAQKVSLRQEQNLQQKREMIGKKGRNDMTVYMKIQLKKPTRQITILLVCMFTCTAYKRRKEAQKREKLAGMPDQKHLAADHNTCRIRVITALAALGPCTITKIKSFTR